MKDPNKIFAKAFKAQNEHKHLKALKLYKKLLKMEPDLDAKKTINYNLGLVLMSIDKHKDAIKYFDASNRIEQSDETNWNKCLCLLNSNNWNEAKSLFSSRYGESRQNGTAVTFPNLPIPQTDNTYDLKNKKVLILNEQGLGDEVLFSTQLYKLDNMVKEAIVQVSESMIDLFNEIYSFTNIKFVTFESISVEEVNKYDIFIGLGDVFMSLYNKESVSLDTYKNTFNNKVGVCWRTNRKSPNTEKRSINPNIFSNIKFELESLQYGKDYGKEIGLKDFLPENCLETWKKMDDLDVVVTVDTLVAHLAGLKGIPTLLIVNEYLDWRWKYRDKEDNRYSMFYPNIEIINVNDNINDILNDILR